MAFPIALAALLTGGGALAGGLLAKKQKAPQIPHVSLPGLGDYEQYKPITSEIERLTSQPGFGSDFTDKAGSPIAQSMRRDFKNITSPFISNQYSARGLGRSNLVADRQIQAEGDVESDIGNMFSQLYQLNEIQKSNQGTQALQGRERLLDRAIGRNQAQAGIDIGLPQQQFALDQSARQETNTNRASGAEMGLGLADILTGRRDRVLDLLEGQGLGGLFGRPQGPKANLLKGSSDDDIYKELMERGISSQMFGGR